MNCQECKNIILSFEYDNLTDDLKSQFNSHINGCSKCRDELDNIKYMIEIIDAKTKPEKIHEFSDQIDQMFFKSKKSRSYLFSPHKWKLTSIAAVLIIFSLFFSLIITRNIFFKVNTFDKDNVNLILYELTHENPVNPPLYQENLVLESDLYSAESLYYENLDIYFLLTTLTDEELEEFNNILEENYKDILSMEGI